VDEQVAAGECVVEPVGVDIARDERRLADAEFTEVEPAGDAASRSRSSPTVTPISMPMLGTADI